MSSLDRSRFGRRGASLLAIGFMWISRGIGVLMHHPSIPLWLIGRRFA